MSLRKFGCGIRGLKASCALVSGAVALLSLPGAAWAQAAIQLPPVPVDVAPDEGLSAPMGTTVISGEELESKRVGTSDTARLLKDIPGISLYTGGGVSSLPVIHGMADDRLKLLVDGMPITAACPNHMNPALSYLDPANVGQIEVMAGITPVSAGGDSIGGTIAAESRSPVFATDDHVLTTGRLSTAYRSTSHSIGASGDVTAATRNVSLGYAGSWTKAGDYHRGGDNAPVRTSQYQIEDHAVTLAGRHDTDLFVLQGGWQFSPYQGFPNQRMDLTENSSKFVNGRYEGQFGWGSLDVRAHWRGVEHEMNFLDRIKGANMPMNTESDELGYGVKAEIPLNQRDTLRVGNEFQRYTLDDWWPPISAVANGMMSPNDFYNVRDGERNRMGTFAEWEAQWTSQWSTLLGVRNDTVWMDTGNVQGYSGNAMAAYAVDSAAFNAQDHSRTDVNFDLTALTRFERDKTSAYEAGYARKTRSPSLYERYTWSTGTMAANMNNWVGDGNGYVGNVDLKPEVAHTLSVTGDWHDGAKKIWGVKVTPYYTYVKDYIDADRYSTFTGATGFGKLRLNNHDAELYGIDISGSHELWDDASAGRGVFKSSVSWVKGRNLDTGDNLYNIMPLNARFAVEHQLGGWSSGVELQVVDSKDTVSNTRNEIKTPGYALVNLRTGYDWGTIAANVGVENVLNQLYHEPLGGADLSDTNRTWGTNVYGAGRTYLAGVTVKF